MLIPRGWDVASPLDQFSTGREASDRARTGTIGGAGLVRGLHRQNHPIRR
jgi:hypothetical protein